MKTRHTGGAVQWFVMLGCVLLAGCASNVPTTSPESLSTGRPGYVRGYLPSDELPASQKFLLPPPAPGSAAAAADREVYLATRKLRDTPRWAQAVEDADLSFPNAAQAFSCALDLDVSPEATPHLNMLLRRVRADASRANDQAKKFYQRQRPYLAMGDASCTPQEKHKDDSYPSGHSSVGWAWALVLGEIAPERGNALIARGLAFGESRVICGVHWKSDIEAGRLVAASVVSRLHADPEFSAQRDLARREIAAARHTGKKSSRDCAAEARALRERI